MIDPSGIYSVGIYELGFRFIWIHMSFVLVTIIFRSLVNHVSISSLNRIFILKSFLLKCKLKKYVLFLSMLMHLCIYQQDGDVWVFTVRTFDGPLPLRTVQVNYGGFAEGERR